jgi:hypothetical protein
LYSAVNRRRWVFSVTSGSGVVGDVGTDDRLLALYTKFSRVGGLKLLGTEGGRDETRALVDLVLCRGRARSCSLRGSCGRYSANSTK